MHKTLLSQVDLPNLVDTGENDWEKLKQLSARSEGREGGGGREG